MRNEEGDYRGPEEIERELARLVSKAAPSGLRQKVLEAASKAKRNVALTPSLRFAAVACSAMIVAILVIDPLAGRHEAARLAALLDVRSAAPAASQETELAEVLNGEDGTAERMVRLRLAAAAAARKEQEHQVTEARRWLKGWLEDETSENLI